MVIVSIMIIGIIGSMNAGCASRLRTDDHDGHAAAADRQKTMSSYLANFATKGDPNGDGLPVWPRYTSDRVMELGDNVGPIAVPDVQHITWFEDYFAMLRRHASGGGKGPEEKACSRRYPCSRVLSSGPRSAPQALQGLV